MSTCASLGMVLSVALWAAPAESGREGVRMQETRAVDTGLTTQLAQLNLRRLFGGGWRSGGSGSGYGGSGNRSPVYPTRPVYPQQPNSPPQNVIPPSSGLQTPPEPNVVALQAEPNRFLEGKVITAQQVASFKDRISSETDQLAGRLGAIFPGNDGVGRIVSLAKSGKLSVDDLRGFVLASGAGLSLQQQFEATVLLKQVAFNSTATAALLSVNVNNLNVGIGAAGLFNQNINVNVIGGGASVGYWGFPWWPWTHPVWLGPGVWWGPCASCPHPYYNPGLIGVDACGLPYSLAAPAPNYEGEVIRSGILLANAGTAEVNYTLDGRQYSMRPDYRQPVARTRVAVAFDRGGSFGRAEYGIDQGWYKFTVTDNGWELFKHTAKVTISNSDNSFPFRYVLDNRRQTLQAGYQQEHTGAYPLEIRFDNGRGEVERKIIDKGVFTVAVGSDGGLDLFRPNDVTPPAPIAQMAQTYDSATKNIFAEPEKIRALFGDTAVGKAPGGPAVAPKSSPGAPNLFGPEAPPSKSPAAPNLFGPESSPPDASPDAPNLFAPPA